MRDANEDAPGAELVAVMIPTTPCTVNVTPTEARRLESLGHAYRVERPDFPDASDRLAHAMLGAKEVTP